MGSRKAPTCCAFPTHQQARTVSPTGGRTSEYFPHQPDPRHGVSDAILTAEYRRVLCYCVLYRFIIICPWLLPPPTTLLNHQHICQLLLCSSLSSPSQPSITPTTLSVANLCFHPSPFTASPGLCIPYLHHFPRQVVALHKVLTAIPFVTTRGWQASDWTASDDRVRGGKSQVSR